MSVSVTVRPGDSYSSPTWISSKYRRASAMRALEYHADTTLPIGGAMERRHFLTKTALDVLQGAAQKMAKMVDDMSGGRLKIQVFAGGELMPPFGCFDACSQGTI